jgi:MFS family permease
VYPYRFVCLVLFFLAALVNSFAPNTFVATAVTARNIYDEPKFIINLNSLAYTIMHPLVLFPANYILDQVGLKFGLNLACAFMILGYGLKLLINVHFWIFVVGTFVTGLGFIFLLNSPTKFIGTWFPASQVFSH